MESELSAWLGKGVVVESELSAWLGKGVVVESELSAWLGKGWWWRASSPLGWVRGGGGERALRLAG